jgi:hemerythrin-like domain-containing protein
MDTSTNHTAGGGCDTWEMPVIHRVFRREFGLLPKMIRAVSPGDLQRASKIGRYAQELLTALHHHHTSEDELLWPKLNARVELEKAVVQRMETQHESVGALIQRAEALLPEWSKTGEYESGRTLADVLEQMCAELKVHLQEEEEQMLPVVERYITAQEWEELGTRGMASIPKNRLLVQLGHILEECSPDEQARFLAKVPLPGRIAWRLVGQRKFRAETADLREGVLAG